MEHPRAAITSSPVHSDDALVVRTEVESQLSSLVYGLSQQVQMTMENMLKMINEIDQNSAEIAEDIEKCKCTALERKKALGEGKEHFQQTAYTVLEMLNNRL